MVGLRGLIAVLASIGLVGGLLVIPALTDVARAATQTIAIGVDHSPPGGHNFEYVDFFPRGSPGPYRRRGRLRVGQDSRRLSYCDVVEDGRDRWPSVGQVSLRRSGRGRRREAAAVESASHRADVPARRQRRARRVRQCRHAVRLQRLRRSELGWERHRRLDALLRQGERAGGHHSCTSSASFIPACRDPSRWWARARPLARRPKWHRPPRRRPLADTAGALAAETAASTPQVVTNSDGTHTVTLIAGTATNYVEVVEMLPGNATVTAGDTVRWVTKTIKDPHTVTFPLGSAPETEPIPTYCEGSPDSLVPDRPQTGPAVRRGPVEDRGPHQPGARGAHDDPDPGDARVVGHHRDAAGAVPDLVLVHVPEPGHVHLPVPHPRSHGRHADGPGRRGHADHDHTDVDRIAALETASRAISSGS